MKNRAIHVGVSLPGLYPSTMSDEEIKKDRWRQNHRDRKHHPMKNKVVYIHPLRRYLTVEFMFDGGTFRESFLLRRRGGNAKPISE